MPLLDGLHSVEAYEACSDSERVIGRERNPRGIFDCVDPRSEFLRIVLLKTVDGQANHAPLPQPPRARRPRLRQPRHDDRTFLRPRRKEFFVSPQANLVDRRVVEDVVRLFDETVQAPLFPRRVGVPERLPGAIQVEDRRHAEMSALQTPRFRRGETPVELSYVLDDH